MSKSEKAAIAAIEKHGALLVFPIDNRKEPLSIWSCFYPRSEMRWEWDEDGDNRVAGLWHLRADLSTTKKVVYVKWYQGRATYLSRPLFTSMLRALNPEREVERALSPMARKILSILDGESPLSTKELKRIAELKGKDNEAQFMRAMKELWSRLLIVAFGEVDDGAFPSLAVGSTRVLFEDLWTQAFKIERAETLKRVAAILPAKSPFAVHFAKLLKTLTIGSSSDARRTQGKKAKGVLPPPKAARVIRFEDLQ